MVIFIAIYFFKGLKINIYYLILLWGVLKVLQPRGYNAIFICVLQAISHNVLNIKYILNEIIILMFVFFNKII